MRSAHAQGFDRRLPRILNSRGDAVADFKLWVDAVQMHEANSFDASAARIAAWEVEQVAGLQVELTSLLTLMEHPQQKSFTIEDQQGRPTDVLYSSNELDSLRQLARLLGGRDPAIRAEDPAEAKRVAAARTRFFKRAAILHTDTARLASTSSESRAGQPNNGPARPVIKFYDGQLLGVDRSSEHWELARNLLDRVTPSRDPDVRLWYRATLTWMLGAMQLHGVHFHYAQQLYPEDAAVLYLEGCLHETLASPRVQNIAKGVSDAGQRSVVRSARAELGDAETNLQRALHIDLSLTDARLRLGRVQSLLGKQTAAVVELQRGLSSARDPLLLYYGNLFLGSALESTGNRGAAQAAYERASLYYPDADAPHLALSRLAVGGADHDGAMTALEPLLRRGGRGKGDDPWSGYYVTAGRGADAELAAAYEALLKTNTQ